MTACSVETGSSNDSVGTEELEKKVDRLLTEKVGQSPKDIDCPDKLKAEEGAKTRCTLTASDGTRIGVTVTAGERDGDKSVRLDIKVDDEPQ
ncbi:DUF4333 domain-containing protein [Streptomyces sp. SB3404]|uniref:DUF4333 domain-containing protein n=1 Tax=Streptomyces boncukensis TaxID=2711219 RepID=A0A6G4X7F2_9ACTN|nr:DUF4333 domain-containing protein [Streptomyces boncukensis]